MASILITGATSGLGEALTYEAIAHGHEIIACGRNVKKLAELARHDNVTTVQFDATHAEQTRQALLNIRCDIAVLNAGTCEYVDIQDIDPDMFKRVFDVNVLGSMNVAAAIIPNLEKGNKLVFVDSMARLLPFTKSQAYGASKAAIHYACKSFETDLQSRGISVQSLSPGFVKTPLTEKNDFPMPMAITAEQAGKYMLAGIQSNKSSVYFPKRFGLIMRFLNFLPESIQKIICLRLLDSKKSSSVNSSKQESE